jgi:FkbM family methyltransferase
MLIDFKYLFKKYNISAKGVIHIGASSGQEVDAYYSNGIERSIWIEALPDVYKDLVKRISKYPNAKAFNSCISDKDGEIVSFNVANNEGQSSSLLPFGTHSKEHPTVKFTHAIEMVTRKIDTLFHGAKIKPEDYTFLNIDLQGAELMALKGMGKYLETIEYAYIEINKAELYKGCPLVEEIDEYLLPYGLKRVETKWTDWGWGDGFYIKETAL